MANESLYPNIIDGFEQLPIAVDRVTPIDAVSVNSLRSGILNIEIELGILPSGDFPTVKDRLDSITTNGAIQIQNVLDITDELEADIVSLQTQIDSFGPSPSPTFVAAENIIEGELLRLNVDGEVEKADSDTGTVNDSRVIGASAGNFFATVTAEVRSVPGTLFPVRFSSPPAGASNGQPVYLSTSSGRATLTPPTSFGSIIFLLGILQGADGLNVIPDVLFQPRFIAQN